MPSLGGLASTLYQMGQQAREDQLRQIQQNKEMQDRHLKFVEGLANDPTIDPAMRPEIIQHWLETSSQTPEKFKPEKTTKWFGDISQRHHQAQVLQQQQNDQADQESQANPPQMSQQQMPDLQSLIGSAVPDASGQMPLGASPMPPMGGGEPLPTIALPDRTQMVNRFQPAPFFDPGRPLQREIEGVRKIMAGTGLDWAQASDLYSGHPVREPAQPRAVPETAAQKAQAKLDEAKAEINAKIEIGDTIRKRTDLNDEQKKQYLELLGIKPDQLKSGRFMAGSVAGAKYIDAFPLDMNQQPIDPNGDYKLYVDAKGEPVGLYPTQLSASPKDWVKLENGGFGHVIYNQAGKVVSVNPAIPPAYLMPTINTQQTFRTVTQPDGSTQLVPVQTQSNRSRDTSSAPTVKAPAAGGPLPPFTTGATPPAPPAPPGAAPLPVTPNLGTTPPSRTASGGAKVLGSGVTVGGRPLTPEQKIKNEQQTRMLNTTIGTIKDVQSKADMLASMYTAGKIGLQIDPQQGMWKGVINKNISLTPEEAQLAAEWQLLTEQVLQMRIPMGGAGFRGPEGFGAIESNKGILTQHPEIIKRVLNGTLKEFQNQRKPLAEAGTKYGYSVDPEAEHGPVHDFASGPPNPPGTVVFIEGKDEFHIPREKVDAFKKAHPAAKEK